MSAENEFRYLNLRFVDNRKIKMLDYMLIDRTLNLLYIELSLIDINSYN
jgi:hypothetical protein